MKKLMAIVMSALSAAVAGGAFAASEIYVDAAVESAGDGLSWATAYKSVEQAVKDIEAGGTVYVKGGTYQLTESIELTGKNGVSLLGGYTGDGAPGARDVKGNASVLDAGGQFRVMRVETCDNTTISGFTFTNGKQSTAQDYCYRKYYPTFTLKYCGGAGLSVHCKLAENAVGSVTVQDCAFSDNAGDTAQYVCGGGLIASWVKLDVKRCTFSGNSVKSTAANGYSYGGAVAVAGPGAKTFTDCVFHHNLAKGFGANVQNQGGAFFNEDDAYGDSPATLSNCLFYANRVETGAFNSETGLRGGAISGADITCIGCTFAGQPVEACRSGAYGKFILTNCVLGENGIDLSGNQNQGINPVAVDNNHLISNCLIGRRARDDAFKFVDTTVDVEVDFEPGFVLASDSPFKNLGYQHPAGTPLPDWTDLYVDPAAAEEGTGAADSPFRTVTAALAAAGDWTRIHLAAGTYSAASNGETFPLEITGRIGIKLIGAAPRATVFDGGSVQTTDLSLVKVVKSSLVSLSDLQLVNCWQQKAAATQMMGAALYAEKSQLRIRDCRIADNRAQCSYAVYKSCYGAAVSATMSGIDIARTDIEHNLFYGGGMWWRGFYGGGIAVTKSSLVFDTGRLVANGIAPTASFNSNDATYVPHGGGIYIDSNNTIIRNALIVSNNMFTATSKGNLGSYTNAWGAAIGVSTVGYPVRSYVRLENCTLDANRGANSVYNRDDSGVIVLKNTFVQETEGDAAFLDVRNSITPTSCAFTSENARFTDGENGNILLKQPVDKAFRGAAKGDYRLTSGSELVDKGEVIGWMTAASKDLYGRKRLVHKIPDIGCSELGTGLLLLFK